MMSICTKKLLHPWNRNTFRFKSCNFCAEAPRKVFLGRRPGPGLTGGELRNEPKGSVNETSRLERCESVKFDDKC